MTSVEAIMNRYFDTVAALGLVIFFALGALGGWFYLLYILVGLMK